MSKYGGKDNRVDISDAYKDQVKLVKSETKTRAQIEAETNRENADSASERRLKEKSANLQHTKDVALFIFTMLTIFASFIMSMVFIVDQNSSPENRDFAMSIFTVIMSALLGYLVGYSGGKASK